MNSMFIHYSVHCFVFCPIHLLQVFIVCNVIGHFASIIVNIIIYAWLYTVKRNASHGNASQFNSVFLRKLHLLTKLLISLIISCDVYF